MSKHARLIVAVLIALTAVLAAAIVIFRADVNKDYAAGSSGSSLSVQGSKSNVFVNEEGLCGLEDSAGNIILEAEWQSLVPIGNGCYKATLETRGNTLCGVIDSEGDISVPFVYSNIEKLTELTYAATLAEGGIHIYSGDFRQLMPESWDSCSAENKRIHLTKGEDRYIFVADENLQLWEINIPRFKRPISFELSFEGTELNRVQSLEWSDIADKLLCYLDAYRRSQPEKIEGMADEERITVLRESMKTDFQWKGSVLTDPELLTASNEQKEEYIYLKTELQVFDGEGTAFEVFLTIALMRSAEGKWLLYDAEFTPEETVNSDFA